MLSSPKSLYGLQIMVEESIILIDNQFTALPIWHSRQWFDEMICKLDHDLIPDGFYWGFIITNLFKLEWCEEMVDTDLHIPSCLLMV